MSYESVNANLKRNYRMTEAEFDAQLTFQGGVCAMCKGLNPVRPNGTRHRLCVDHNHRTGENRDLLCDRCNRLLGLVDDNQELILRALFYLREHDGSAIPFTPPNLEFESLLAEPEPVSSHAEQATARVNESDALV